jgi:hypothetical protein
MFRRGTAILNVAYLVRRRQIDQVTDARIPTDAGQASAHAQDDQSAAGNQAGCAIPPFPPSKLRCGKLTPVAAICYDRRKPLREVLE